MTFNTWIKKKKNKQLVFFMVGIILLYFYIKRKNAAATNPAFYQLPSGAGGLTTGGNSQPSVGGSTSVPGYAYSTVSLPFTYTHKNFFTLVKNGNSYSEEYAGDRTEAGQKRIDANGRTYTAWYWINEVPLQNENNQPIMFENIVLPVGLVVSIRKAYIQTDWVSTFDAFRTNIYDSMYNVGQDENLVYKTCIFTVTT